MLCQKCKKNNADVFYKETKNGETKSFAFCSQCAEEVQNSNMLNFTADSIFSSDSFFMKPFENLDSLLGSMFSYPYTQNQNKTAPAQTLKQNQKQCDMCKITFNELAAEGKVGCPKCYDTFAEELNASLNRIHGNVTHIGRTPKLLKDKLNKNKRLRFLKAELQTAIETQEFEKAVSIRDEIRSLEQE